MEQADKLISVKWSLCTGDRHSVSLKPQVTYLPQFFNRFANPTIIPEEEFQGLDESQIKDIYKENAGYFTTGHASVRRKDQMDTANLLVIDGDTGSDGDLSPIKAVHRTLRDSLGLNHLIHSSFTEGRWRLLIPVNTPVPKDDIKAATQAVVKVLQEHGLSIEWAKENGIISQPWFFPVTINSGAYECFRYLGGELFDTTEIEVPQNKRGERFDKNYAISQLLNAETLHPATRDLAMSMVGSGINPTHIQLILTSALKHVAEELTNQGNYKRARDAEERIKDIPRMISTANEKINPEIILPELKDEILLNRDLTWPPGVMGEVAASMYEKSMFPIKEVAICSGFGLIAGLGGRSYNVNNCGINIYLTLLMRTGMGKDSVQKFITQILNKLEGGQAFLGGKSYTSAKGLLDDLRMNRSKVCVFTEAGFMYESTAGAKADLSRNILDLFNKSGEQDMVGAEIYSSIESSIRALKAPALTIINESTPDIFNKNMISRDATNTGERARMLAFNVNKRKPRHNRNMGPFTLDNALMTQLGILYRRCTQNQTKDTPEVIHIQMPGIYHDMIDDYRDRENDAWENGHALESTCLSRVSEKLNRITGCLAALENPHSPEITQEMLDWAQSLIEYELATVYNFIGAENESDFHENVIAPMIVRILQHERLPKDLQKTNEELHRNHRFTARTILKLMMQNRDVQNYLGNKPVTQDVINILRYFIDLGCLEEPTRYKNKHKVYRITPQFMQMFSK